MCSLIYRYVPMRMKPNGLLETREGKYNLVGASPYLFQPILDLQMVTMGSPCCTIIYDQKDHLPLLFCCCFDLRVATVDLFFSFHITRQTYNIIPFYND